MTGWELTRRTRVQGVEIAYDILGEGPPAVLVHGFPSNACIWREVAPRLAETHAVHVYDLPGQGASERREEMDVSDPFQARVLHDLLRHWRLDRPAGIFHDIGACYGMTAYHFEGCRFERVALISAAVMNPCISAATQHAQRYLEAYRTMPNALYELIVRARLQSTTAKPMREDAFAAYLRPWQGALGQALWFNRVAQISSEHIAALEARLGPMDVPVRIVWGDKDSWIPPDQAERLRRYIGNAEVFLVPDGGHFLMEDAPDGVARLLADFLASPSRAT